MHHLKVDIVDPDTNTVLKSNVNMTFDGKKSIGEMNAILLAQGGNCFRVIKIVEEDPFLSPVREF
tara:strand:+ start:186 stop:380 length:195 start_codon:yes stop_codon:yes gene_type:complete